MSSKFVWVLICFTSLMSALQAKESAGIEALPDSVSNENAAVENPLENSTSVQVTSTQNTDNVSTDKASLDNSLESLMNAEVTSVSRKAEPLSDAPAAITVITQEDIRRSGFASLPEVLRLVPGLHVGRISSHKWAISARGFSDEFANKLLVLIDGRSIYNPAFSGVYWESQDLLLEDIERIEVIRGPGATVWGANAVNGVINIITRSAKSTQGALVTGRLGSKEKIDGFRFGTKVGDKAFGRFYIKHSNYDSSVTHSGKSGEDASRHTRAGFRIDWEKSAKDTLTFQGDINHNSLDDFFTKLSLASPSTTFKKGILKDDGFNLMGRWTRIRDKDSDMSLQMYYDTSTRVSPLIRSATEQFDIDFNHHFRMNPRHDIVWGVGYRRAKANFKNSFELSVNTPKNETNLFSAFFQDDITLKEDTLRLILGTKVEHNSFTGLELQPNARMVWTPDDKQTVWAALSRALRTPAHTELGLRSNVAVVPNPMGLPILISAFGDSSIGSEKLLASEIGYRVQPNQAFALDATIFYNRYSDLVILETREPFVEFTPMPPHIVSPFYYANDAHGSTYGVEISPTWKVSERWKLSANYAYFKANLSSNSTNQPAEERQYPSHMFQLRSALDLSKNLTFDIFASYTSKHGVQTKIPGYARVDLHLGWQPSDNLNLSIGVQNLISQRHKEAQSFLDIPREIPRSFYLQGAWQF